ncbi:MAG TPA: class I SAM-dependent methyltransferase [Gemmatimonadaceae bacterium]|nr:class I SAM-dependent methyltransferase [Gemmatimonadaceae bacterium]
MDTQAFHDFEHQGWVELAQSYEGAFVPLTDQATAPLLEAVGAARGVRVLDIACGPGAATAAAAARGADATGVDFSATMVEIARHAHPGVRFQEGDAESLPFADGAFDAAIMSFGLLHLARPEQAVAEAHRVLRAGGRFAFTVWAPPDEAVLFGMVLRAVERLGRPGVALPAGPPFFRFSDPEESRAVLAAAGFVAPVVMKLPLVWRLDAAEAAFEAVARATVRTGALIRAQPPEVARAIRDAVVAELLRYRDGDGIALPMPALLFSAWRS